MGKRHDSMSKAMKTDKSEVREEGDLNNIFVNILCIGITYEIKKSEEPESESAFDRTNKTTELTGFT